MVSFFRPSKGTVNLRKLEHGFRMIGAGFPILLTEGYDPSFWLLR